MKRRNFLKGLGLTPAVAVADRLPDIPELPCHVWADPIDFGAFGVIRFVPSWAGETRVFHVEVVTPQHGMVECATCGEFYMEKG